MRTVLTLVFLSILSVASAQTDTLAKQGLNQPATANEQDTAFVKSAEEMPAFPGGQQAMMGFLQSHIRYPQSEKERGVMGMVYVSYIVETDGRITNVRPLREVEGGPGLTIEAMRIVSMFPNHTPGMSNGKPVRVQMVMPVKFVLQ